MGTSGNSETSETSGSSGNSGARDTAIRELGLADQMMVEELLGAVEPGWKDSLAPGASGATAFLADPKSFMFGAYVNNEPAGWLWGVHVRRPDGRVMTYVHELDVVEHHRRRGIGSTLMEAAVGAARREQSHRLWLVTRQHNEAGNSLYQSLGAQQDTPSNIYKWDL